MCFKCKQKIKEGFPYSSIKSQMRPFDPIFFRGDDFVSKSITYAEKLGNKIPKSGDFSHVGIVVTSEILNDERIVPNKIYVLESVLGGVLGSGVKDISNRTLFGVQIRDFDELINKYDEPNDTRVAFGKLIRNPLDFMNPAEVKQRFTEFMMTHEGIQYDWNCVSLCSALFPCCRPCRNPIESLFQTSDWLFCSELAALLYKQFGILPATINEKNVVPRDLAFPEADDEQMPKIVSEIIYIVSPKHAMQ